MNQNNQRRIYVGILLAVSTTLIWSGNFVVARSAHDLVPPISLAFYRWLCATIIIVPIGFKKLLREKNLLLNNKLYLFFVSLTGIALFNTCVYIAGHYSSAINLALIGTTSSPIMAVILARIFLKEKITWLRIVGLLLCIFGILYLMGQGNLSHIVALRFSIGDVWVLLGAFFFAIYNVLVKKKPIGISPLVFVTVIITIGTILIFPFFLIEQHYYPPINWNLNLFWIILYLGLGNAVICYLCWNEAIARLGTARTALFGNLIPIFASIEAVILLGEKITVTHILSAVFVIIGLIIANLRMQKP